MDKLVEVGRMYDMKINVKKTKTMRMARRDGSVVNIIRRKESGTSKKIQIFRSHDNRRW